MSRAVRVRIVRAILPLLLAQSSTGSYALHYVQL